MVTENERFAFVVTHVEAEGKLLKIWAQTDERLVQTITSVLATLINKIDYHAPDNILMSDNIMSHTFCCALGINNDFCRVKLYSLQLEDLILVKFLDYGNVTYVPIQNIRSLDKYPEAKALFLLPEAASVFVLADVLPIGCSWLDDVVTHIRSILVNNKYYGVYQNVQNFRMLKFTIMENNFSQILINRNMAVYSPCNLQISQLTTLPAASVCTPQSTSKTLQNNWRISASQNAVSIQKVVKSNSFKAIQLEIGSVHDVQISYVDEGPNKFSIQLIESIPYLNTMMEKINSQSHLYLQESPIAGQVCLGKQTSLNRLCRIVLNSPGDTSCKVYYADYGHHEVLSFSDIYQIPDEFVIPNIFSIRFTLSGIMNWVVNNEMKDYFRDLVYNKKLKLRVCQGPMSPLTQYCELFLNGKNLKDTLSETFPELCQLIYSEPRHMKNGTREVVFVTHVESIVQFFIQIESDRKLLEEVMKKIEKVSKTAAKLTLAETYPDMPCIALYEADQNWYRASVIDKVDNESVHVFYVDYGNQEVISINNIRVIPFELIKALPKQAIKCSLNRFQSGAIDKDLIMNFESLVLEERLILIVLNNHQNTVIVDLFDEKNLSDSVRIDIAEKLLETSKQKNIISYDKLNKINVESPSKAIKNKNIKICDNYTSNLEKGSREYTHNNNFESHANSKAKFHKDNEIERFDNRYKRGISDYMNGAQNNRFNKDGSKTDRFIQNNRFCKNNLIGSTGSKDYSSNDRINRSSTHNNSFNSNDFHSRTIKENRTTLSSRLERYSGSEKSSNKEFDTSLRNNGKRSNRIQRQSSEDYRKHDGLINNRSITGRCETDDQASNLYSKNINSDVNTTSTKSFKNNASGSNKSRNENQETEEKISTTNKKISKYLSSTPILKIPPPNITVGAIKNCTMVYYNNPVSFYVQLCPDNEELNLIMNKIFLTLKSGGKASGEHNIKTGLQCIAQYSGDEQWYRAIVGNVKAHEATVQFIDYGNMEDVSFTKIKEIEPEFLKLPAQAVHCKLFCPSKIEWSVKESELLSNTIDDKLLEAEFVSKENGVYNILIKEVSSSNMKSTKYINDLFANGIDLIKEKETIRNKIREIIKDEQSVLPDYASLNEKWLENKLDPKTKYNVHLTWFINPESFYCQLVNQQNIFRDMMNEIQTTYINHQPISEQLKIGDSVIAILPDDGILYRAEIVELHKPSGYIVQYVDYGDQAVVDPQNVYAVEKKFMQLPKQAIFCSLKNITPVTGSNWDNFTELNEFFNTEKFECIFHESKNGKYLISLNNNGSDVSRTIVDKNLAIFSNITENNTLIENSIENKEDIPRMDINLLEGQALHVKVSSVENIGKFYVQFYSAEACQIKVDTFMATKNPQVIPRLSCHEVCLGSGCLVNCRGKWRRGVVVKFTKANCEVRFIDTGELEQISFESMLGLPVQLSVMQNQAIECALFDMPFSIAANETLKKAITGKDIKIFVETIECNRLVVQLFDTNGNKINIIESKNTEIISPICNMQILSSTHDVIITWINNSTSVWLQRISEKVLLNQLLEELGNYYSKIEEHVAVFENQVYAALSDDGIWYRIKVKKVNEIKCTVMFIDFGIIKEIPIKNIRTLESRFYTPHQLSVEVSLTVNLGGSDKVEREALEPLLTGKIFSATFYNVNRKWITELTENGEKISGKLDIIQKMIKSEFVYTKPMTMFVGEKYEVVVSHISSPNEIWIQRIEQVNNIAKLQNQLQQVSSPLLDSNVVPAVKSLCLAMYSLDNQWYRAEVLDADTEITTVRFIDYGSVDVIDNNLARLKQLPDKWKAIDGYAISTRLDILPSTADDWSKEACKRFTDLINAQKTVQALIIANKTTIRIDLFVSEQSICQILVDEKHAIFFNCSEEFEFDMIEEIELDPRSAYVSNIVSVDMFWMQEDKYINELEMMQDRLLMAPILQPLTEIKEGCICIAHFPDDGYYYRAIVLSQNEEGTRVRYIDYGNSALTTDLRVIPEDLIEIQPLSRKCRLAKPDGIDCWPDGVNNVFTKLADEGSIIFLLDVIEDGEISLVKLTYNCKDVASELLDLCAKTHQIYKEDNPNKEIATILTEEPSFPIDKEKISNIDICTVCFVSSLSEFWIHKKSDYLYLDDIMNELLVAENFDLVKEIKEGIILAAKFDEDGQWYRSKVLSHGENGTEVFYIDYGNTAVTDSQSSLRELPHNLAQIRPLATCCSLKMPEDLEKWPKTACEKFMNLMEDVTVEYRFEIFNKNKRLDLESPIQLSLIYQDQNIIDILLNDEKAVKTEQLDM
ncbi:PREDICTED: maternal protein tudor [Ceratosolen solmsi marchali]|uniref:Maternal protein tudor n=1 Tax=Ceratosolen solmsi marchali TaxID=326594 RepID=A0AAJ6YP87_9HYME|nr:PREDICTED: maternal protein tudor [Ceratosolen solmsi marchali]